MRVQSVAKLGVLMAASPAVPSWLMVSHIAIYSIKVDVVDRRVCS
jgi:hypothetical protein